MTHFGVDVKHNVSKPEFSLGWGSVKNSKI